MYPAYQPVPRAPRRRGPILFWFTLALVALAEGLLGIADLAGVPVADAAYPALAVATVGGMLLVGAFYGRAGGLVLLGLVATLALGVTTAADNWEGDTVRHAPGARRGRAGQLPDLGRRAGARPAHGPRPGRPRRAHPAAAR